MTVIGRLSLKILVISRSLYQSSLSDPINRLRSMVPEGSQFMVPKTGSKGEIARLAKDADIIIGGGLSADVIKDAKNLKLIQTTGAGANHIPFSAIKGREIYVANTSGANASRIAEGAFALLMTLAKKIIPRHNKLQQGVAFMEKSIELRGKTLGILGLGKIGREVAKFGKTFSMKVIATKRQPSKKLEKEMGLEFLGGPEDLEKILKDSDFLVITLPLTSETQGLLGEEELKKMKETALLINVGRAEIIQEEPLYKALSEDWIAGAGLDVWYNEYWTKRSSERLGEEAMPSKFPIHTLENVIATPHYVGSTENPPDRMLEIIAENISRITRGEEPINQVDPELGY